MPNEALVNIGDNSAMITYTGTMAHANALSLIDTFLQSHGQELITIAPVTANPKYLQRGYRALNLDGVTYKYMVTYQYNTSYSSICCRAAGSVNATTAVMSYPSQDEKETSAAHHQYIASGTGGKFYLFATARYFFMHSVRDDGQHGSHSLNGAEGVCELDLANVDDQYPQYPHLWLNTGLLNAGDTSEYGSYCMSPVKTRNLSGDNAAKFGRVVTPLGHQGRMQSGVGTSNYLDYNSCDKVMPSVPSPFGVGNRHQIHEIMAVQDTNLSSFHVRGRLAGIKTFTRGTGVTGDIFKIECDDNLFLDPNGTLTDHFIIRHGTLGSYGIPL